MKKYLFSSIFLVVVFLTASSLNASTSPAGRWRTICDNTGEATSIVEITIRNGILTGTIIELLQEEDGGRGILCEECSGRFANQPIVGMQIIWDMRLHRRSNQYRGGRILDPDNGKEYGCRLWREGDRLHVRGFIGLSIAGRTQVWERVSD